MGFKYLNSLHTKLGAFLLFISIGCAKLPEAESSSVVSYYVNGKFVQSFYTANSLVIEPTKNWRNRIVLGAKSETGRFGFVIVSDSIAGTYTYETSYDDEAKNRMTIHFKDGSPRGFSSDNCTSPSLLIVIGEWYEGQRAISGTFSGTVCDDEGNKLEITHGTFEFVRQVNY